MEGVDYSMSRTKEERKKDCVRMWEIEGRDTERVQGEFISPRMLFCLSPFIYLLLSSLQLVNPRRPTTSLPISWFEVFRDTRHQFWLRESIPPNREPRERFRVGSQRLVEWQRAEKFRQLLSFNVHLYPVKFPSSFIPYPTSRSKEDCVGENCGMFGRTGICDWPDDGKREVGRWNGWI